MHLMPRGLIKTIHINSITLFAQPLKETNALAALTTLSYLRSVSVQFLMSTARCLTLIESNARCAEMGTASIKQTKFVFQQEETTDKNICQY